MSDSPQDAANAGPVVLVQDYKTADYRGFVFCVHEKHGLLLLHCTRKAKKGPHYQLPGGHVDAPEFLAAAASSEEGDANAQLLLACKLGAARELYEETGLDVRGTLLHRVEPAELRPEIVTDKHGMSVLPCEHKKRLYFFLRVTDDDFISPNLVVAGGGSVRLNAPMTDEGDHLRLKLSVEHSGFAFEKSPEKIVKLLQVHSGGKGSEAFSMAMKLSGNLKMAMSSSL